MTQLSISIFYLTLVIDVVVLFYGMKIYTKIKKSALGNIVLYSSLSILVFGIHHLGEILLEHNELGIAISESIEAVAAIILLFATYQLYKLSNQIFVK